MNLPNVNITDHHHPRPPLPSFTPTPIAGSPVDTDGLKGKLRAPQLRVEASHILSDGNGTRGVQLLGSVVGPSLKHKALITIMTAHEPLSYWKVLIAIQL